MYTRIQFGKDLKERVLKGHNVIDIGTWAFSTYWDNIEDIDSDFEDVLLTLNKMELGPEFAFTYDRLNQIADDLIAGRNVNLDY